MKITIKRSIAMILPLYLSTALLATETATDDPFIWLEDVAGEKSLSWVKKQNAISTKELEAYPEFKLLNEKT